MFRQVVNLRMGCTTWSDVIALDDKIDVMFPKKVAQDPIETTPKATGKSIIRTAVKTEAISSIPA